MLTCYDCGGKGVDVGSLYEPEACQACQGAGEIHYEDPPRMPMAAAGPAIDGRQAERGAR